jgi:hypothetical protein
MRLGRGPQERQLSPGPVSSPTSPALGKKGDWCRRRFDPDGCLSHVEEWDLYEDLGPDHFDKPAQSKQVHRLIDRLRNLGFAVQITAMEGAAQCP